MPAKRKGVQGNPRKTKQTTKVNNVKENKTKVKSESNTIKIKTEPVDNVKQGYRELTSVDIKPRNRTVQLPTPRKKNPGKALKFHSVIIKVDNTEVISIPEFPDIKIKVVKGGKHPYMCPKCDSGFWTKSAYEAHTPIHILKKAKQPIKKFRCDVCAKEFSKLCDVERHTRVHTGEKPCICNICNKRFQQAHNLSKHLLTHLHIKPFHCEICNKQFGRNDVLRRHLLTHSVDKPVKCSVCHRGFIRHSQLLQHMRRKHPDQPIDELTEPYADMVDDESSDNREDGDDTPFTKDFEDQPASSSSESKEVIKIEA